MNQLTSLSGGGGRLQISGSVSKTARVTINSGSNSYPATALWGTNFNANIPATLGTNIFSVVAQDANTNLVTNKFQMTVSSLEGNRSFSYDANGNTLSDGQRTYTWDAENRLASVSQGTNTYSFGYDFAGRRATEKLNGTLIKQTVWDVAGSSPTPLEERDGSNVVSKRFFSQGEQQNGTNYFYFRDHLGSVRELVDGSGVVHAEYSYDPYGAVTKVSGDRDATFQYAGYYAHAGTGLNLTWYRAYDPITGRWHSRDPIGEEGGINLYGYVGDNPLVYNDLLGLWQITFTGGNGRIGGVVSFGNNGGSGLFNGQWNLEGDVGLGAGFSANLDTSDSGCHKKGSFPQLRGSATLPVLPGLTIPISETWNNSDGFKMNWGVNYRNGLFGAGSSLTGGRFSYGGSVFAGTGVRSYW